MAASHFAAVSSEQVDEYRGKGKKKNTPKGRKQTWNNIHELWAA
jgi:predicted transcriptional regulator YdeE